MKIFIDFDDVIFNSKKYKNDLIGVFRKNGVTRQEFDNSYYSFSKITTEEGKYYDPKKQIKLLKKRFRIDNEKLQKDLDDFLGDLSGYIFPDVRDFLASYPKKNLFLLTYGHIRFQKKKVRNSGIGKCFRKVLVTGAGKDSKMEMIFNICDKYGFSTDKEDVILIDDRPEQLERDKEKEKKIKTFRICRPQGRYSDLICFDKDWEVKNLKEVSKIIKKEGLR